MDKLTTPSGDNLLQELEESIPQGVPNATRHEGDGVNYGRRASDLDLEFASLDSLLNESMEKRQLEDQYKRDRESRSKGYSGMSKEEIDFCNSRMHAFEMAREWDADYALAVFVQNTCLVCGSARTVFSRLMEHHQHRRVRTTQRWLVVASTKVNISPCVEEREVPMCVDCMETTFGLEVICENTPWLSDILEPQEEEEEPFAEDLDADGELIPAERNQPLSPEDEAGDDDAEREAG